MLIATFIMGEFQYYQTTKDWGGFIRVDDRRVLAASAFFIENRSDLLEKNKLAFFPLYDACNVGQYVRGQHDQICADRLILKSIGSYA